MTETRIDRRFAALKEEGRAGLVVFVTGGDPNQEIFEQVLAGLPENGVDFIEVGLPFSDPQADGPTIQLADIRALKNGQTTIRTLAQVSRFREKDNETPIILMGYYNPIYHYGVDRFLTDAKTAGVDGFIIVDLPTEEDDEMCVPAMEKGFNFIRLVTPMTDEERLPHVLRNTSGFVYYVSIAGITGTKSADAGDVGVAVERLKRHTDLPVVVGFGINTPEQAADIARIADGAVVGTAVVNIIGQGVAEDGAVAADVVGNLHAFTRALGDGVRNARKT